MTDLLKALEALPWPKITDVYVVMYPATGRPLRPWKDSFQSNAADMMSEAAKFTESCLGQPAPDGTLLIQQTQRDIGSTENGDGSASAKITEWVIEFIARRDAGVWVRVSGCPVSPIARADTAYASIEEIGRR